MQPVTLSCGETVLVTRIAPMLQSLILQQSREVHPTPDPKPFQRPMANAASPDLLEPAEMNPEYVKAVNEARAQQVLYFYDKALRCGIVAQVEGEETTATVERYRPQLTLIRAALGELDAVDDWQAVVLYILIQTSDDRSMIIKAAQGTLTQEDVERAAALFRRDLQRRARAGDGEPSAA